MFFFDFEATLQEEEKPESACLIEEAEEDEVLVVPDLDQAVKPCYIKTEYQKQLLRLKIVLHPLLHGFGEKGQKGLLGTFKDGAKEAYSGNYKKAWEKTSQDAGLWQVSKTVIGGVVGKYAGKEAERVLFHGGFYDRGSAAPSGSSSMEALLQLEGELRNRFPGWSESQCREGILKCPQLGFHSKLFLKKLDQFILNIEEYYVRTGYEFFDKKDVQRIMQFVDQSVTRICEENVKGLFSGSKDSRPAVNDDVLKPYCKIMDYLLSVPIEMHDIESWWEKNSQKIDEHLAFLPCETQQRDLYDYMLKILNRSKDKSYGHCDGDSGIHLLFSGDTGTGKTFVGKNLPPLLGFSSVVMTLEQFKDGQQMLHSEIEDLIDEDLSGLEQSLLRLDKQKNKSLSFLNQIIFIDEIDEDRIHSVSDLKDMFDQFKRIYLPGLGLHLPGFLNCIFTTNNKKLLKDPALISRFTQIVFPLMEVDRKYAILLIYLGKKLSQYSTLLNHYKRYEIEKRVLEAASFKNGKINIRVLIANLDSILNHLDLKQKVDQGKKFLIPFHDRQYGMESYPQFLDRKFSVIKN